MEELRECPCGNKAHLIFEDGTKVADPWSVACKNFDCPWVFQTFPTKEEAVKHWNTRPTDPLVKQLKDEIYRLNTKIDEDIFAALADDSVPRVVFCAAIDAIANKDELLKEMAKVLDEMLDLYESTGHPTVPVKITALNILQKYHKQEN